LGFSETEVISKAGKDGNLGMIRCLKKRTIKKPPPHKKSTAGSSHCCCCEETAAANANLKLFQTSQQTSNIICCHSNKFISYSLFLCIYE
jgi:hypothetical protein